jgi:hypothetical protein
MQYSLGNTLKGGGAINPDGLALDLQFAADKTLTARKGPTPVFTRANATATFIGSNGLIQTAGVDIARFDHDPITLACKGLLIEEQRTNLVFPSDALTTQTVTVTAVAHTLSFYGTGTVVLSGTHTATVTGTGAYPTRTTLTFTPTAGSLILTVTGSVTQAQLEAGSFVTSYIPTVGASAIRSADVCSITGTNFTGFYNTNEGTFIMEGTTPDIFGPGFIGIGMSAGVVYRKTNGGVDWWNGAAIITTSNTVANWGNLIKIAAAYVVGGRALCLAGGTIATSATSLANGGRLEIGRNFNNTGNYCNGRISAIRYFKKRLPDVKLQSLTT